MILIYNRKTDTLKRYKDWDLRAFSDHLGMSKAKIEQPEKGKYVVKFRGEIWQCKNYDHALIAVHELNIDAIESLPHLRIKLTGGHLL